MQIEFYRWLSSGHLGSGPALPSSFGAARRWDRYATLHVLFRIHPRVQIQAPEIQHRDLFESPCNFSPTAFGFRNKMPDVEIAWHRGWAVC